MSSSQSLIEALAERVKSRDQETSEAAEGILDFIVLPDPDTASLPTQSLTYARHFWDVWGQLSRIEGTPPEWVNLVTLAIRNGIQNGGFDFLGSILYSGFRPKDDSGYLKQSAFLELASRFELPAAQLAKLIWDYTHNNFDWTLISKPDEDLEFRSPFTNFLWSIPEQELLSLLGTEGYEHLGIFAKHRPHAIKNWFTDSQFKKGRSSPRNWHSIISHSDQFDDEYVAEIRKNLNKNPWVDFIGASNLYQLRPEIHRPFFHEILRLPGMAAEEYATESLVKELPEEAIPLFLSSFEANSKVKFRTNMIAPLIEHACDRLGVQNLDTDGGALIDTIVLSFSQEQKIAVLPILLRKLNPPQNSTQAYLLSFFADNIVSLGADDAQQILRIYLDADPTLIPDKLWEAMNHSSKLVREIAVEGILKLNDPGLLSKAKKLLAARKANTRLGAIALLAEASEAALPLLQKRLEIETAAKVQTELESAIVKLGGEVIPSDDETDDVDILATIEKEKRVVPPAPDWLDLSVISLQQVDGSPLPEKALHYLLQKQSKHKTIDPAPAVIPLLALLDRPKNAAAGLTILEQWFNSAQVAKDRWALTIAGLLSDTRIIPPLVSNIQPWCEASRHKLAEYAAQAISLVPGDEALVILDSLANRYRSRFKNIGKACREALETAAENRGVSIDELADLIVPTLDFNEEGERAMPDTEIRIVLQPDFKLTFFNPETEKEVKSPPSSLPDSAKEDIKVLRKLIRETLKGQTTRLELSLVRQRRWPVARWQELFEINPILQSFATRLVWAAYDEKGELRQTFRRYPNGLLANATGGLVEFSKKDHAIGMVHPLELDEETLQEWRQHMERMKVKAPFPQLDRPVVRLESSHANRKTIGTAKGVGMSCGTFRSRAEKRGWMRGSVIDAGGISCYYKDFPGAGFEVYLMTEDMWVGQEAMDDVSLGEAYFTKTGEVTVGSYSYDEPVNADDKRVLNFGAVPPIVYSETLSDLEAIVAGQR